MRSAGRWATSGTIGGVAEPAGGWATRSGQIRDNTFPAAAMPPHSMNDSAPRHSARILDGRRIAEDLLD
ncbi:hypothetical protein, partial [Stenotrophomonas sp.]|uniref:hypothetical protein n=1 Tax=Stenotrophomonas sp. TaxID=69392 RepID=UPI00257AFAE0